MASLCLLIKSILRAEVWTNSECFQGNEELENYAQNNFPGARKMAQQVRALDALVENLGLSPIS